MIQNISKQNGGWHMQVNGIDCFFIPMALYKGNNIFPEKPNCDNGLRWRINRKWISYNQIKQAIKKPGNTDG